MISKKRNKRLRRRATEFTNSGIPLLNDSNDKPSSSLCINERNQLLDNELRENQTACISSTVDSLVDLDNGSSKTRDEMVGKGKETSEPQSPFNDGVLQNSDLSLLEILQCLQNESGSVSEASNPPMTCPSTAGLINNRTSTTTVENNIRNIEENISVTQEELITKTDNNGRLQGCFCSDVVFNLSYKVLTDLEISVLGKELGFSPTPTFINEADLRRDFADFARKMRFKWFFRNEPTEDFSEILAFRINANWSIPKGLPALEIFLSQMKGKIFSLLPGNSTSYNLIEEEWRNFSPSRIHPLQSLSTLAITIRNQPI